LKIEPGEGKEEKWSVGAQMRRLLYRRHEGGMYGGLDSEGSSSLPQDKISIKLRVNVSSRS